MYDRSIKMFDEPHAPEKLQQQISSGLVNKAKIKNADYGFSYLTQIQEILNLNIESVFEVGPADNLNAVYFEDIGIRYESLNLPGATRSKYQSKLEDFDANNLENEFDLVAAFQMLEHSPYELFISNVNKLKLISKKYIFISLPYDGWGLRFNLTIGMTRIKRNFSVGFWIPSLRKNRVYRKEYMEEFPWAVHYWEIGRQGYPLGRVLRDITNQNLRIVKRFHGQNPYHYFILVEKI